MELNIFDKKISDLILEKVSNKFDFEGTFVGHIKHEKNKITIINSTWSGEFCFSAYTSQSSHPLYTIAENS